MMGLFYHLKIEKIPILPLWLDIEPTNRCNFNCPHCKISYWNKNSESLQIDSFKRILIQFPNLNWIKLQGMGEPLLCQDFFEILLYAEKELINVEFTTNGSIYNKKFEETINKLNRTKLRFSIDGSNEFTFNRMRPDGNFTKIKENILKVTSQKGSNENLQITLWMVLSKYNYLEIPSLIKLAKELNVNSVGLQMVMHDWANPTVREIQNSISLSHDMDSLNSEIEKAKKFANESEVKFTIENQILTKKNKCRWPFTSAYIAANGDVVPCCWLADSSIIKMGNVFDTPFREIWNSPKYQDFRGTIKKHKLHDFCKSCYHDDYFG